MLVLPTPWDCDDAVNLSIRSERELCTGVAMNTRARPDPEFGWEVMKLLLHIAWANEDMDERECTLIMNLAERLNLASHHLKDVRRCLNGLQALPPPSVTMLRTDREQVRQLAEQMVMAKFPGVPKSKGFNAAPGPSRPEGLCLTSTKKRLRRYLVG